MATTTWLTCVCVLAVVLLLGVVALDRNRMRQRMDNTEGVVTGLTADLQATQALARRLQTYLNDHASWEADAVPPQDLASTADRWSPLSDAVRPAATGHAGDTSSGGSLHDRVHPVSEPHPGESLRVRSDRLG